MEIFIQYLLNLILVNILPNNIVIYHRNLFLNDNSKPKYTSSIENIREDTFKGCILKILIFNKNTFIYKIFKLIPEKFFEGNFKIVRLENKVWLEIMETSQSDKMYVYNNVFNIKNF